MKHISKSNVQKHSMLEALLEAEMLKKCAPFWRESHAELKSVNTDGFRPPVDVLMSFRVAGARASAPSQKRAQREGFVAVSKT